MINPEGYTRAVDLLFKACIPQGFVASTQEKFNYRRVWTRDGVITGLAALSTSEKELHLTFKRTLDTIFTNQHPLGFIPSNVTPEGQKSYGGTVGRADNPSWAVIGLCYYTLRTRDHTLIEKYRLHIEKCFHILDIWEYNGKHLLYVPQSGDWADEYFYHGYVLFDQLLRIWALRLASTVLNNHALKEKADTITAVVRKNFWFTKDHRELYTSNLQHQQIGAPRDFWFMGFNPSRIYPHFDLQANALALLLKIGDPARTSMLLQYIKQLMVTYNGILPSFYPVVKAGDPEMLELKDNHAYGLRNAPNQFHNGGLWPVWNGFLTAALVAHEETEAAHQITYGLHSANESEGWMFNECLHGETKQPIGTPLCTWSAAGAVIAENALTGNNLFDQF